MAVMPEKDKQLRPFDACDDGLRKATMVQLVDARMRGAWCAPLLRNKVEKMVNGP